MTDSHTIYGAFNLDDVHDIQIKIPCESASLSSPLTCVLQFQSEKNTIMPADTLKVGVDDVNKFLRKNLQHSFTPKLLEKNGDYAEPSQKLLDLMNFEFAAHPSLLHAVAKLHTRALILDKETVFIIAAEAYSRSKAVDVHSETSQSTWPTTSNSNYGTLCAGIFDEADGGTIKRKLKVGSTTMNILVTMSVRVKAEKPVDIGPETTCTPNLIRSKTAKIFYRVKEIEQFIKTISDPWSYKIPPSAMKILSLRQLTSGFEDPSTFQPWRAIHDEFATELTTPTTVFTLCNTPSNMGYGVSATSTGKLASQFLQSLAISVLYDRPRAEFGAALKVFETNETVNSLKNKEQTPTPIREILYHPFVSSLKTYFRT